MKFSTKECNKAETHNFQYLGMVCTVGLLDANMGLYKCTLCGLEEASGVSMYDFRPVHKFRKDCSSPWRNTVEETFEEPEQVVVKEIEL